MQFLPHASARRVAWTIVGLLFLICAGIWSVQLSAPAWLAQPLGAESGSLPRIETLLSSYQGPLSLDPVEKTSPCSVDGPLPDPSCTPGAVFSDATLDEICTPGYTQRVRSVSVKLKKQIYAAYDIPYPPPTGTYELDHLIPLALGGSNDAANLFPEAANPTPGFKEKDVVEVYLYEKVCAGYLPLVAAQEQIARNWLAVYQALDPSDIARIKKQYPSWAN